MTGTPARLSMLLLGSQGQRYPSIKCIVCNEMNMCNRSSLLDYYGISANFGI